MEKNKTKQLKEKVNTKEKPLDNICTDKFCPVHGKEKLRTRGRSFQGEVIRKFNDKVTISFERMIYISKYEGYERRTTKIHSRLPPCMADSIEIGDRIQVAETRPISKMIHTVVVKVISKKENSEKLNKSKDKNESNK